MKRRQKTKTNNLQRLSSQADGGYTDTAASVVTVSNDILPVLTVAVATLVLFAPTWFHLTQSFLGSPFCDMNIAYRHYLAFGTRWLKNGVIPQWNPHIYCGTMFLPSTCATLHHPLNALVLIFFPLPFAANIAVIVHALALSLGVYAWGRSNEFTPWKSALAAVLSVASTSFCSRVFAGHFTMVCSFAWVPWFFLSVQRMAHRKARAWLIGGLFGALIVLGGHLQIAYYAFLLGSLLSTRVLIQRRRNRLPYRETLSPLFAYAAALVTAMCLSAIELLPVFDALRDSARMSAPDTEWVRRFSFPIENLVALFFPNIFGTPLEYFGRWFWWEVSHYVGVSTAIFAILALSSHRKDMKENLGDLRFLCIVALFLALIPNIQSVHSLFRFVPGWYALRGHAKIAMFAVLVLPLLAVHCMSEYVGGDRRRVALTIILTIIAISAAFIISGMGDLLVIRYASAQNVLRDRLAGPDPSSSSGISQILMSVHRAAIHTLVVCGLVFGILIVQKRFPGKLPIALGASLMLADELIVTLPVLNTHFIPTDSPSLPAFREFLQERGELARVEMPSTGIVNSAMSYSLSTPGGNDINISRYYDLFLSAIEGKPGGEPHLHFFVQDESPLLDCMALKYLLLPSNSQLREGLHLEKVKGLGDFTIWRRPTALPYAYVVQKGRWITETELFNSLRDPTVDFHREVILTGEETYFSQLPEPPTAAEINARRESLTCISLDVPTSGIAVISEGYSRHWRAFASDKRELPVYQANGAFLAVPTESPGKIQLRYENKYFNVGRLVTALSVVLFGFLFFLESRQSRTQKRANFSFFSQGAVTNRPEAPGFSNAQASDNHLDRA